MSLQNSFQIDILPACALESAEQLRDPLLVSCVRSHFTNEVIVEEIDEIIGNVRESVENPDAVRYYAVARTGSGMVVGMMGLAPPEEPLKPFVTTDNPIEIVNAYVAKGMRGLDIGSLLLRHLLNKAEREQYEQVLLSSGPRYEKTGWPFWDKQFGESIGVLENRYDGCVDAKVWGKLLMATAPKTLQ